ncbi:hypothetical protein ACPPVS_10395 [Cellulomonas sp. McL0617]|uniref:hypothetical protein n=1 Tax=Cellulomonas sp. McL0617 TaxID=3415675 RepID=UPI003CE6C99D
MSRATVVRLVRLVGPPSSVVGVVDVPSAQRLSIVLVGPKDGALADARVLTAPVGAGRTEVRLLLPQDAEPGETDAELLWDGGTVDVRVVVLGRTAVQVRPRTVQVAAAAGAVVPVAVHVVNCGNVAVEVAKVAVLAFEESETLEAAIVAGLSGKAKGLERWGVVADTVAARQAGPARIVVTDGAGPLLPGADAWVAADVHVPEGLGGADHAGTWELAGARVRVELQVQASDPKPRSRRPSTKEGP